MNDSIVPVPSESEDFDLVIDGVLNGLESDGSRRVYSVTYMKWYEWCQSVNLNPLELFGANVALFLRDQPVTKTTRSHYLSHLKKITSYLSIHHDGFGKMHQSLCFIKVPTDGVSGKERSKTALKPDQVNKLLSGVSGDRPTPVRNLAMIALSLATGARRAEIVALKWHDINADDGVVSIRHGKGDKYRDVAIVGDFAFEPLEQWRVLQSQHGDKWEYVFTPTNKGDGIGPDKPIHETTLYKAFKLIGVELDIDFAPHDLRRTLATELFNQGAITSDVQAQLGHADSSTTNKYSLAASAQERRKRFRTRYGD